MRLKELNYFIEVAITGSLSRAAERLGITQPSLSLSIKRLEEEVGVVLFHRYKTGVKLTVGGLQFLTRSKELIQLWEDIKFSAFDAGNKIEGKFTLGCHPAVGMYHIPSQLSALLKKHPKLNLTIVNGLSRELNEAIISMKIDIGIIVNPIRHPDLVIIKLREDKVGFWCKNNLTIDDKNITLLCDSNLNQTATLTHQLAKTGGKITRIIECHDLFLLSQLAYNGVGVAILPESIVKQAPNDLTRYLPSLYYRDEICLVYRHESRSIKAIQAMISCFRPSAPELTLSGKI